MLKLNCEEIWDINRYNDIYVLTGQKQTFILNQDLSVKYSCKLKDQFFACCFGDNQIIIAGKQKLIYQIDYIQNELINTIISHGGAINSVCYNHLLKITASGSAAPESAIKIFKDNEVCIIIPRAHDTIVDLIFNQNQLISTGMDGQIKVWDIDISHLGVRLIYKENLSIRLLNPVDSVYHYDGVVLANMPNFGIAVIFLNVDNPYMVQYKYGRNIVIGVQIPLREQFWHRSRGYKNTFATGGKSACYQLVFPTRSRLSEVQNQAELQNIFQLFEYQLHRGIYRAVIANESGVLACGVFRKQVRIVQKTFSQGTEIPIDFERCVDDVFFPENMVNFIQGTHQQSFDSRIGVGVVKQQ